MTIIEEAAKVTSINKHTEETIHIRKALQLQQQRQSGGDFKQNKFTVPQSTSTGFKINEKINSQRVGQNRERLPELVKPHLAVGKENKRVNFASIEEVFCFPVESEASSRREKYPACAGSQEISESRAAAPVEESVKHVEEKEAERPPKMSELVRRLQREHEEQKRRILAAPFTAYRIQKQPPSEARASHSYGIECFVPLLAPPLPFPTDQPSNRTFYLREKMLRRERGQIIRTIQKSAQFCAAFATVASRRKKKVQNETEIEPASQTHSAFHEDATHENSKLAEDPERK